MLKKEIHYFFNALMFFTRIPCPNWLIYNEEYLNKSRKYFPLIGWIVGGISALVFWGSSYLFSAPICILLSIIATVWTTGAFHEDGFTDVCDSFGGGWGKEQILTIMKDSRIGAYGVIGVILLVMLKFFALYEIAQNEVIQKDFIFLLVVMINAHTTSRFIASTFVHTHEYVQDLDKSKVRPIATKQLSWIEMLFSFVIAAIPFALFQHWIFVFALPISYVSKIYLGYYFKKHIGGYTGDCLGATQQISEVVFYLAVIALTKFIE
jgi:adenosylcobinamide-GDP ribazoletransferase